MDSAHVVWQTQLEAARHHRSRGKSPDGTWVESEDRSEEISASERIDILRFLSGASDWTRDSRCNVLQVLGTVERTCWNVVVRDSDTRNR